MVRYRPLQIGVVFYKGILFPMISQVLVPLQIGVVFNILLLHLHYIFVLVPLQIGVVFNKFDRRPRTIG